MLENTPARLANKSPSNPATLEKLILPKAALDLVRAHPEGAQPGANSSVRWVNWAW